MKLFASKKFDIYSMTWLGMTILLFLVWVPFCVMHYPARIGGGSNFQIDMFYGVETTARNMGSIIYEGHYITNHHPVLLTLYYGIFFKIGNIVGHTNIAVFGLSMLNLLISSFCMAYSLVSLRKYMTKTAYYIALLFVCLNPLFGGYSYTICKDNIFAAVMLVFATVYFEVFVTRGEILDNFNKTICLLFCMFLLPFLKNQGFLIVIMSMVLAAVLVKKIWKKCIIWSICLVLFYMVFYNMFLLPALKIAPGGKQEAFSVPFNQTAAYFKQYSNEVTDEEYEIVDKILPADELASLYQKERADSVKFRFKKDSTGKDMANYLKVWFAQLLKHPGVYFQSFYDLVGGYFWPGYDEVILDLYYTVNLYYANTPLWVSNYLVWEDEIWNRMLTIPVLKYLFRPATYSWIMMAALATLFFKKKKRLVLSMIPVILSFLVLLLCPWNGVLRYELPLIWCVPIYVCIFGMAKSEEK